MTAFGKQVGMLRVRRKVRGSEGGSDHDRFYDESIRVNANNSVVNTIELTEIKNGDLSINSTLI